MKKILLFIAIIFGSLTANAQDFGKPSDPAPNVTVFGGPYVQVNSIDYFEFGALGAVNFKDIFAVGPFYQYSIKKNQFYGLYTQVNVFPKEYYFQVGLALKTGLNNHKLLSFEPGMSIQHNNRNDNIRFTHFLAFTGGPTIMSYSFGVVFGNFGEKYWKNPRMEYMSPNRTENSRYYNYRPL